MYRRTEEIHILIISRNSEFKSKIRAALHRVGIPTLHEAGDLFEAEIIAGIREFDLILFTCTARKSLEQIEKMSLESLKKLCRTRQIPFVFYLSDVDIQKPELCPEDFCTALDIHAEVGDIVRMLESSLHIAAQQEDHQEAQDEVEEELHEKAVPNVKRIRENFKKLKFFHPMSDRTIDTLFKQGALKDFKPGQVVFKKGVHGSHFCVVLTGQLEVRFKGKSIAFLSAGDCFGEMSLIKPKEPRSVNITTLSKGKLFILPRQFLDSLKAEEQVEIYRSIMVTLVEKLKLMTGKLNRVKFKE